MTEKEILIKSLLIRGYISAVEATLLLTPNEHREPSESDTSTFLTINKYFKNETKL